VVFVLGRHKKFCCTQQRSDRFWGTSILLSDGKRGLFPRSEADQSPPSTAEVKNGGAIPPLYHTSSWPSAKLITHRDTFTFLRIFSVFENYLRSVSGLHPSKPEVYLNNI
jgi:hypothetical protein